MNRSRRRLQVRARSIAPRTTLRRALFTLICLFTFSMQSYVAATHIHETFARDLGLTQPVAAVQASGDVQTPLKADHNRVPTHDSRDDCPLCRAVVHAGAFLFPTLLIVEIPGEGIVLASLATVSKPVAGAVSHSWSIRGPPRL